MIEIDKNHIVGVYSSCANCVHFNSDGSITCRAFKHYIPDEILNGEDRHTKKHKNQQNDIVFEEITANK